MDATDSLLAAHITAGSVGLVPITTIGGLRLISDMTLAELDPAPGDASDVRPGPQCTAMR